MSIKPVMTIEGTTVTSVVKGLVVELIRKDGEVRMGVVENGEQPNVITLKLDKGFRSYKRDDIASLAYVL